MPGKAAKLQIYISVLCILFMCHHAEAQDTDCKHSLIQDLHFSQNFSVDDVALWSMYEKDTANRIDEKFSAGGSNGPYKGNADYETNNSSREHILSAIDYNSHKADFNSFTKFYLSDNSTRAYIECIRSKDSLQAWIEEPSKNNLVIAVKVNKQGPSTTDWAEIDLTNGTYNGKNSIRIPASDIVIGEERRFTIDRQRGQHFYAIFSWGGRSAETVTLPPYRKYRIKQEDTYTTQDRTDTNDGPSSKEYCISAKSGYIFNVSTAQVNKWGEGQGRITRLDPTRFCAQYIVPAGNRTKMQLEIQGFKPKLEIYDQ
ncbi:hypothetical protein ACXIT0_07095 [Methylorubrum extorquens]